MTIQHTVACEGRDCLALFVGGEGDGPVYTVTTAQAAGWRVLDVEGPHHCPACDSGKGPVLERGECPVCMGSQVDLADGARCHYCGHVTPHPDDELAEDDENAGTRCPAAHPSDNDPCSGPVAVAVVDQTNAGTRGCEHHAARVLASLEGGHPYALEDAPEGAAARVFRAAAEVDPLPGGKAGTLAELATRA